MSLSKIPPALLAEHITNSLPPSIRTHLIADAEFGERYGLRASTLITMGTLGTIDQRQLFATARLALTSNERQEITNLDGAKVCLTVEDDGIALRSSANEGQYPIARLDDLFILSPRRSVRRRAIDKLIARIGPTASDHSAIRRSAWNRILTDDEAALLVDEAAFGVAALQLQTKAAIDKNEPTIDDLVPHSIDYFDRYCGPNPKDTEPEEYIGEKLPAYRKRLLKRDITKGLDICLAGALHDGLSPALWVENVGNDLLLEALAYIDPLHDPFSLLGSLDIALGRIDDRRFKVFATDALKILLQDKFERDDGVDAYELLPLFANLVLARINELEGGASRAPFWKRMCAWMQAGYLIRQTKSLVLNFDPLQRWLRSFETVATQYATILDLQREPMYGASDVSKQKLREEIVGRLTYLREKHQDAAKVIPLLNDIDEVTERLTKNGRPLAWVQPGPLDGHVRPSTMAERALSSKNVRAFTSRFSEDLQSSPLSDLAYISQTFDLGSELLGCVRDTCAKITLVGDVEDREQRLGMLVNAAIIAAAHRDQKLADLIGERVCSEAGEVVASQEAVFILRIVMLASAAIEENAVWEKWLENRLSEMASRLPNGEPTSLFLRHLQVVKGLLDLKRCIHARAEAIASASN